MERECDKCIHKKEKGCEKWNCEFEPKYADPTEDAGTLAEQKVVHCNFIDTEMAKEFIKDVKAVESVLPDAEMWKFVSLTHTNNSETYIKADAIVQLIEGVDSTFVYTTNSGAPMSVKESMDEILVRIGGTVC